ncbi:hypothetical protein B0T16DRAFT_400768 [Cercophora newfieldiana]|uniref:Uncharacterized protein n=1 Tax=Cercophora newfieldiana TaxID=92897 RepID=A0AA39YQY2_9PEZI|nr:hypothetical protein B0T16DRAFT_400768 [Cercophora newfieldiana]
MFPSSFPSGAIPDNSLTEHRPAAKTMSNKGDSIRSIPANHGQNEEPGALPGVTIRVERAVNPVVDNQTLQPTTERCHWPGPFTQLMPWEEPFYASDLHRFVNHLRLRYRYASHLVDLVWREDPRPDDDVDERFGMGPGNIRHRAWMVQFRARRMPDGDQHMHLFVFAKFCGRRMWGSNVGFYCLGHVTLDEQHPRRLVEIQIPTGEFPRFKSKVKHEFKGTFGKWWKPFSRLR